MVDVAVLNLKKTSPNRKLYLIFFIDFGFVIGAGYILAYEFLTRQLKA